MKKTVRQPAPEQEPEIKKQKPLSTSGEFLDQVEEAERLFAGLEWGPDDCWGWGDDDDDVPTPDTGDREM